MEVFLPQHSGRFYEELPNTADYVSYRLACNKDDYPEPYSPPINPPLTFLPQHPYHSPQSMPTTATGSTSNLSKNTFSAPSHATAIFKYPSVPGLAPPPPGGAAYTFPKEQYVWFQNVTHSNLCWELTTRFKSEHFPKEGWKNSPSSSCVWVGSNRKDGITCWCGWLHLSYVASFCTIKTKNTKSNHPPCPQWQTFDVSRCFSLVSPPGLM